MQAIAEDVSMEDYKVWVTARVKSAEKEHQAAKVVARSARSLSVAWLTGAYKVKKQASRFLFFRAMTGQTVAA